MSFSDVFSYTALVHAIAGTAGTNRTPSVQRSFRMLTDVGGSTAMTAFYPLDVIRTHQQVSPKSVREILAEQGVYLSPFVPTITTHSTDIIKLYHLFAVRETATHVFNGLASAALRSVACRGLLFELGLGLAYVVLQLVPEC